MSDLPIALLTEVTLDERDPEWRLAWNTGALPLGRPTPTTQRAWRALALGFAARTDLAEAVNRAEGPGAVIPFLHALGEADRLGLLRRRLSRSGAVVADLCPLSADFSLGPAPDPNQRFRLSRFADIHAEDGVLIAESPLGLARLELHDDRAMAWLLARRRSLAANEGAAHLEPEIAGSLLHWAVAAGILAAVDRNGVAAEDRDPALTLWERHDLLFHARSRLGRTRAIHGRNPNAELAPEPETNHEADCLDLPRPEQLADASFRGVVEERRSHRRFAKQPIDLQQLSAFLHGAAGVRHRTAADGHVLERRPYPNGGASYELTLYLLVHRCQGLEPGVYRYLPHAHQLARCSAWSPAAQALLDDAVRAADAQNPQILVTLASNFANIAAAYRSVAYAMTLKNAGALLHQAYLTATALGLGACAIGRGDADQFCRAAGVRWERECAVAEFLLGATP